VRLEWLPGALDSLERQMDYIAERNPRAAVSMGDAILAAVAGLGQYPRSGRPGRVPGTYELVVTGTPFVVVYRIEPGAAVILRVLHGAQQWPPRPGP